MKKIYLIVILFQATVLYAKGPTEKVILEKKIIQLRDSLRLLTGQSNELLGNYQKQDDQIKLLNDRISQASDTIANQNSLFDGFGVLYGIITIVITLMAIALPILTYQFGIKPSQEALKKFEVNIDSKFEDYLSKTRNRQIDQAIENIKSQNQELKTSAVTFLSLTQHQGFTDEQLFRLFQLVKSSEVDQVTKGTISYCISNRRSDYATEFFQEAIKDPSNVNIKFSAIRYFANTGIESYLPSLRNLIDKATDKNLEFNTLTIHSAHTNKHAVKVILNDKELIDGLDSKTLGQQKASWPNLITSWQVTKEEFEKTYLYAKLSASAQ